MCIRDSYQGGIVPGNELRVVNIVDTDVEACCGTHCDNTSEVGWVKMLRTNRIQDGVVRLYFVAGERTIEKLNYERDILNDVCDMWSISAGEIVQTASRFFQDVKKLSSQTSKQEQKILSLEMKYVIDGKMKLVYLRSSQKNPTLYFSFLAAYAEGLKANQKGAIYIGQNFVFGQLGDPSLIDLEKLKKVLQEDNEKVDIKTRNNVAFQDEKKKTTKVDKILQFSFTGNVVFEKLAKCLAEQSYEELNI
eukprot:TRINITY_DN1193_c0_g2_i13.p2 TRINITY_DN1193_c0_g2~~TRINITY_DN1193_c0_g2_i13.p2  ORF type:complete len:249 (-),score=67.00 TRINITY_DN1193_c0_g2_i13:82-828(-)